MNRLRSHLPDWAVVVGIAGTVGAAAAIVAVAAYRDLVVETPTPISVESE